MSNPLKITAIIGEKSVGLRAGCFELSRAPAPGTMEIFPDLGYTLSMEDSLLNVVSQNLDIDDRAVARIEAAIAETEKELEKKSKDAKFEHDRAINALAKATGLPIK